MRTSISTSQLSVCGEREFSFRIPCNNSWQKKGAMIRDAFSSLSKTRKQRRLFQQATASYPPDSLDDFASFLLVSVPSCAAPTPTAARHEADTHDKNKTEFIRSFCFRLLSMQCSRRGYRMLASGNFPPESLQRTHFKTCKNDDSLVRISFS